MTNLLTYCSVGNLRLQCVCQFKVSSRVVLKTYRKYNAWFNNRMGEFSMCLETGRVSHVLICTLHIHYSMWFVAEAKENTNGICCRAVFQINVTDGHCWRFSVVVTSLCRSTKLLYARPG